MAGPSTRLRLRVSPGARNGPGAGTIHRHGDGWKVRVAAPPEGGRANEELLRLLADRLALPKVNLKLVAGRSGREKIVELSGIDESEAERRLEQASYAR